MFKTAIKIAGGVGLLIVLMGAAFAVEDYFAKEVPTTLAFEEVRLDISIVNDRIDAMRLEDEIAHVRKKIDRLEVRWGDVFENRFDRPWQTREELKGVMPNDYKEDYTELLLDEKRLEKAIDEKNKGES